MIYGNWVAIHKGLVKHLPEDRPYTILEAMFCLSVDIDNKNCVSVSGYSSLWKWSRTRVRKFLEDMDLSISYSESTDKKQNQKGQIEVQIRDRSETDKRQIRFIAGRDLYDSKDRSETDKEQIKNRSKNTTIDPINNPNPKKYTDAFERWWKIYPERNGRKAGKKTAFTQFKKIPETEWKNLKIATDNYSKECNGLPKDAERFLKNDFWKDFVIKVVQNNDSGKSQAEKEIEETRRLLNGQ